MNSFHAFRSILRRFMMAEYLRDKPPIDQFLLYSLNMLCLSHWPIFFDRVHNINIADRPRHSWLSYSVITSHSHHHMYICTSSNTFSVVFFVAFTYGGHGDHHEVHAVPVGQAVHSVHGVHVAKVGWVAAVL